LKSYGVEKAPWQRERTKARSRRRAHEVVCEWLEPDPPDSPSWCPEHGYGCVEAIMDAYYRSMLTPDVVSRWLIDLIRVAR
jgi:hypothetical protein